jgi:hypothetical protein
MLQIKAASGRENPGVLKNFSTDSIKGGSSSPFKTFSSSELEGGMGGAVWNCKKVPMVARTVKMEIKAK